MNEHCRDVLKILPSYASQFIEENCEGVRQIMFGGPYAKGAHNAGSDVDLIIILPKISYAIRNVTQFVDGWIDLAIHDYSSIESALRSEQKLSICALADDIHAGIFLKPSTKECFRLKALASQILTEGPGSFDFDGLRNHLLGLSSDLPYLTAKAERSAVKMSICHKLAIFAVRAKGAGLGLESIWEGICRLCSLIWQINSMRLRLGR